MNLFSGVIPSVFVRVAGKRLSAKGFVVFFAMCLLLTHAASVAAGTVEEPTACKQCGMDRTAFARSRMLIVYEDGTTVGVCSLHCAVAELKQNKERKVRSIMVADYGTKDLVDARGAVWVIGGKIEGVMTSLPKWAFAKAEDAQKFVDENGGKIATFDEAMKAAEEEVSKKSGMAHEHHHDHGGAGGQMLFNPAFGDMIYHTHPAGMWMANYKFMHMDMRGLRDGTTNVDRSKVGFMRGLPYNYMMIPTSMTMDMHMFMVMYGITDRLTVMAMANYQVNEMKMLMDMGPGRMITEEEPMRTSGFGDTELRGMYKLNKNFVASLGLSLPTGSIEEEFETMGTTFRDPYDMQLGSGTYDLKPALTYSALSEDGKWNWGGQAQYTWHTAKNENDWSFGDNFKVMGWLQRALGPFASWARLVYNDTGRIRGEDPEIRKINHPSMGMGAPMPDADPDNYGGQRLDGLIGISFAKGPVSLGVEGGIPLYQHLNGLQLKTDWFITAGIQAMF